MDKDTEIRKLAHALHAQGRAFNHLQSLSAQQVVKLRMHWVNHQLAHPWPPGMPRLAALSVLLPSFLAPWVAGYVLGPVLAGHLANHVPPHRLVRLARYVSPSLLAECAPYLVPERIHSVLEQLPLDLLAQSARILASQKQYSVLGALMDVTPEPRVLALMNAVPSPYDRLSISRYVSQKARMARLMDHLSDSELKELIAVAFTSDEFLSEMGALVGHMTEPQVKRTAKIFAGLLDSHVQGLLRRLMSSPRQIERFTGLLQALPERSLNTLVGAIDGLDDTSYQALQVALLGIDKATEVLPKVLTALHADAKTRIGGLLRNLSKG